MSTPASPSRIFDVGVCIDPGHGGATDPGTQQNGLREADVTLAVARAMADALALRLRLVVPTRVRDEALSLARRTEIARQHGVDYFISLHVNAVALGSPFARTADGAIAYCMRGTVAGQPAYELGADLVKALLDSQLVTSRGPEADVRGVGTAGYYVLRKTAMPSVLLELGFASHPAEAARMLAPGWASRAGETLAAAVVTYLERSGARARPENS